MATSFQCYESLKPTHDKGIATILHCISMTICFITPVTLIANRPRTQLPIYATMYRGLVTASLLARLQELFNVEHEAFAS